MSANTLAATLGALLFATSVPAAPAAQPPALAPELQRITLTGLSMMPALPPRSVQLMRTGPAAFAAITRGSVVVFRHSRHGNVAHRAFRQVAGGAWWTRGDANRLPDDEYVTAANFLGVLVSPVPAARAPVLARAAHASAAQGSAQEAGQ